MMISRYEETMIHISRVVSRYSFRSAPIDQLAKVRKKSKLGFDANSF